MNQSLYFTPDTPGTFALSAPVGSGKTRAAIAYMGGEGMATQNFIYVAPTIALIKQTTENLRASIEATQQGAVRNVHLIHSETRAGDDLPVAVQTLQVINDAVGDVGQVVIVTTKTFLQILPSIQNRGAWRVILDEAFSPIEFQQFFLGRNARDGWAYFHEVFAVDPENHHQVIPAPGKASWLEELATGNLRRSGQKYKGLQPFAAAVANPALRCELVLTERTKALLEGTYGATDSEPQAVDEAEAVLLIACYVTPEYFTGFKEALFMSALFEQSMLFHLWTRVFGVAFDTHPEFPASSMRNIHKEQGPYVAVGHLLHPDDSSSKHNLGRNIHTGAPGETEPGQRVIDRLVDIAATHFTGSKFLLQVNAGYGYDLGSKRLPDNAIKIPTLSHGLNDFQEADNVATLAVTNPVPQQAQWIKSRTGLTMEQTLRSFRIFTAYQGIGRSSIRKAVPTTRRKTFLTVGRSDAVMLHELFEGSTFLGQVGDMPSLEATTREAREAPAVVVTAQAINDYLGSVDLQVSRVSSRSVKLAVAPDSKARTWARAGALASVESHGWVRDSQAFVRRNADYYGFPA